MKKLLNLFIILFGLGIVTTPWLAGLWGEHTAERIGNTKLTPLPEIKTWQDIFSASLASDFLKGSAERAPLRQQLIKIRSQLFFDLGLVLDPIPVGLSSEQITLGKQGWVYYLPQFLATCPSNETLRSDQNTIRDFISALQSSGKEFYVTVAPDKSMIHREFENFLLQEIDCYNERLAREQNLLTTFRNHSGEKNFIDLWSTLRNAKTQETTEIYPPGDTHWNHIGKIYVIKTIIEKIQPDLFDKNEVEHQGFKALKLGPYINFLMLENTYNMPMLIIKRPQITNASREEIGSPSLALKYSNNDNSPYQNALIKKKTVIIHDSFFGPFYGGDDLAKYFSEVIFIHHDNLQNPIVESYIKNADMIIWESVERDVWLRMRQWINLTNRLQS